MQTTYTQYPGIAYPGLLDGIPSNHRITSKKLESATVSPGILVSRGTDKAEQALVGGTDPLGVVVRSLNIENTGNELVYVATDMVAVIEEGVVWVELGSTGTAGSAIFSVDATGVIHAGTAGADQTHLKGELLTSAASSGDLVKIYLGMQI